MLSGPRFERSGRVHESFELGPRDGDFERSGSVGACDVRLDEERDAVRSDEEALHRLVGDRLGFAVFDEVGTIAVLEVLDHESVHRGLFPGKQEVLELEGFGLASDHRKGHRVEVRHAVSATHIGPDRPCPVDQVGRRDSDFERRVVVPFAAGSDVAGLSVVGEERFRGGLRITSGGGAGRSGEGAAGEARVASRDRVLRLDGVRDRLRAGLDLGGRDGGEGESEECEDAAIHALIVGDDRA